MHGSQRRRQRARIRTAGHRHVRLAAALAADLLRDEVHQFAGLAKTLTENEQKIVGELADVQGKAADIGGYYLPDAKKTDAVMRPSATLNAVIGAGAA